MAGKLFIKADHTILYAGARVGTTYLNTGTCTWKLKGPLPDETELAAGTLDYVSASNGNYEGGFDKSVVASIIEGRMYALEVTFTQSPYDDFRRIRLMGSYRTENE